MRTRTLNTRYHDRADDEVEGMTYRIREPARPVDIRRALRGNRFSAD